MRKSLEGGNTVAQDSEVRMLVDSTIQTLKILKKMERIGMKRKGTHILWPGGDDGARWAPLTITGLREEDGH